MDLFSLFRKNWLAIVNGMAIIFAVLNFLLDLGLIDQFPALYVSALGVLNSIAVLIGVQPIPGPTAMVKSNALRPASVQRSLSDWLGERWFIVLNLGAVLFALAISASDFGWIDQYPGWYLGLLGVINFVAEVFGFQKLAIPSLPPASERVNDIG